MNKAQMKVKKEYRIYLITQEKITGFPLKYPISAKKIQDFKRDCEAMGARVSMRKGEYYVDMRGAEK